MKLQIQKESVMLSCSLDKMHDEMFDFGVAEIADDRKFIESSVFGRRVDRG